MCASTFDPTPTAAEQQARLGKRMKQCRLLLVLALALLLAAGCGSTQTDSPHTTEPPAAQTSQPPAPALTFTPVEARHEANKAHPFFFHYLTAADGLLTVNIQESIYNSVDIEAIYRQIRADVDTLCAVGLPETPLTVFIVEKLQTRQTPWLGSTVYCRESDVGSPESRGHLLRAALSEYGGLDLWKLAALETRAFGDVSWDAVALHDYYAGVEDMDILSLFPAYFIADFASAEELQIAAATAYALADYTIETHGVAALLGDTDCRNEWLAAMGVEREFSDPYAEALAGYSYNVSNSNYPLVVTTGQNDVFYMRFMADDLETPLDIRIFLSEAKFGIEAIFAVIEQHAPQYYSVIMENASSFSCSFQDAGKSHAVGDFIIIDFSASFPHEFTHTIIPSNSLSWQCEALAEYFRYTYSPMTGDKKNYYLELIETDTYLQNYLDEQDDYKRIAERYEHIYKLYLRHAEQPETYHDIDAALAARCSGKMNFIFPDQLSAYTLYQARGYSNSSHDGDELTYKQAYAFASYLIKNYSLSHFLRYCLDDISFDDAFGADYADAKAQWIDSLMAD